MNSLLEARVKSAKRDPRAANDRRCGIVRLGREGERRQRQRQR